MDPNTLAKYFENGVAQAEASKLLNQSPPVPRPPRNPDQEQMLWHFRTLRSEIEEKRKADDPTLVATRTTILSGDIHSCFTPFEELKPIRLRNMKVPMVHKGRYLVCKVVGKPYAIIGVNVLIQDLNGDVEEIAIYNFRYKIEDLDWLNPGTILVIKEPWLRYGAQSKTPSIRVDSPSDIIIVDPADEEFLKKIGASKWYESMSKDAEFWRQKANDCFKKGDFEKALFLYDRAIRCNPELAVLYLNKSMACLKLGAFYKAYEAAKIGLEKDSDREKALYRMGKAAYGMREWQKAANHYVEVLKDFPENSDASAELVRANARLAEQQNGTYNLKTIFLASRKEKADVDVADYSGPIKISKIPGKGRGIVATEDIKEGTLLVVSKAFASGYSKDFSGILFAINIIRRDVGQASKVLQVIQTMQTLKNNPQRANELYDLYDGESVKTDLPMGVIDAAKINKICAFNSFASDELDEEGKKELMILGKLSGVFGDSHLFILPSYFNHSCLANAHRTFYGNVMVIHATADIQKGDEICISYCSPLMNFPERKETLKSWKFTCRCKLCEIDANDEFYSKRNEMFNEFEKFAKANKTSPHLVTLKGEQVLKKIRKTYSNRNEFKLVTYQMLMILASMYFASGNSMKSVKCLDEIIKDIDDEFKYAINIATVYVNLAHSYSLLSNSAKVEESIQKAMKFSFCKDREHFMTLYPELAKKLR